MSRRRRAVLATSLLIAGLAVLWIALRPRSAAELAASADALVAGIRPAVTVDGSSLLAARAIADFGVGAEVRLVVVRIVDELAVVVRLETASDISVASIVRACLVGPDAAPDDAGLEDRCWGDEELGPLLEAQLRRDVAGRLQLVANDPVTLRVTLRRGEDRCDYPPGTWHLELLVDPVVDGSAIGPRYAPMPTFEVPYVPDEPLSLVAERRYCGLASRIYREQGEPTISGD